ncbi:hypothetical protein M758_12G091400 [Ceratodon purpureus]|nr:hypothetical protein M758_12G091400 [Ceratodon purpureus]
MTQSMRSWFPTNIPNSIHILKTVAITSNSYCSPKRLPPTITTTSTTPSKFFANTFTAANIATKFSSKFFTNTFIAANIATKFSSKFFTNTFIAANIATKFSSKFFTNTFIAANILHQHLYCCQHCHQSFLQVLHQHLYCCQHYHQGFLYR